jgi:hypothetical protein
MIPAGGNQVRLSSGRGANAVSGRAQQLLSLLFSFLAKQAA